ncbi:hypothetical protein [Zooshikella sp. RANM57]|uniref:hypothetical protein n=1 Tax=Zooshikella sp. RANM57 TaxID=3425863 RepID=UPI003D70129B
MKGKHNILLFNRKSVPTCKQGEVVCDHTRIKLSRTTRTLQCLNCGKEIDPFDHCWRLAEKGEQIMVDIRHLKAERDKIERELEELRVKKSEIDKS